MATKQLYDKQARHLRKCINNKKDKRLARTEKGMPRQVDNRYERITPAMLSFLLLQGDLQDEQTTVVE
jgi:hypothetical protein